MLELQALMQGGCAQAVRTQQACAPPSAGVRVTQNANNAKRAAVKSMWLKSLPQRVTR